MISKKEELLGIEAASILETPEWYEEYLFSIEANEPIEQVIQRATSILHILASTEEEAWSPQILPEWFVSKFSPELNEEEKRQYLQRSYEDKVNDEDWDVLGWMYWRESENKLWYWWGTNMKSDNTAVVALVAEDELFSTSDFKFLVEACGGNIRKLSW